MCQIPRCRPGPDGVLNISPHMLAALRRDARAFRGTGHGPPPSCSSWECLPYCIIVHWTSAPKLHSRCMVATYRAHAPHWAPNEGPRMVLSWGAYIHGICHRPHAKLLSVTRLGTHRACRCVTLVRLCFLATGDKFYLFICL